LLPQSVPGECDGAGCVRGGDEMAALK
jgi:hypothetical protein